MAPTADEVDETLRRLRKTPAHFKCVASGLGEEALRRPPEEGSWSVNEVLAHLRGASDVQGGWIARMLADDAPALRYASPRTGMRKGGYAAHEFRPSLDAFTLQRKALVATLSSLAPGDWARSASFTGTTPGWTQTVYDVARGIAGHEGAHFDQISATAAAVVEGG